MYRFIQNGAFEKGERQKIENAGIDATDSIIAVEGRTR